MQHLKHLTCLSLSSSFFNLSFSSLGQPFVRCPTSSHEMRELFLFLLLHLLFISSLAPSLALDLALVEANATYVIAAFLMIDFASLEADSTLVTKVSLSLQHMLKGDF